MILVFWPIIGPVKNNLRIMIYDLGINKSVLSLIRVFLLSIILNSLFIIPSAWGAQASLFVSPSVKSYIVGQTFTITLNVSADLAVNAVEGSLVYPTDKLEALSVSKTNSIIILCVNETLISKNK